MKPVDSLFTKRLQANAAAIRSGMEGPNINPFLHRRRSFRGHAYIPAYVFMLLLPHGADQQEQP